jgi:ribosome-associated protein
MADTDFQNELDEELIKSKTQLKNESLALQKIGLTLVELGAAALAKVPLDEELSDAVLLARRINKKKDGYRRQLQFIGKLLRARDTADIERALAEIESSHLKANQAFHKLEDTRDQLIKVGDDAINALLNQHSDLDRQKLRQLVRQANKQQQENKPAKASRELFQYLKEHMT